MVVRAVAKRHFLQRFSAPPLPDSAPPARPWRDLLRLRFWRGLLATHRRWRRLQRARAQPQKFVRKATRGDSLYLALRQYLLYHWQLPLIPHYTPLPVSLVRKLGPRILDYRSSQSLKALLLEHSKQTAVPVPASKPKPILHKIFAQPEHAHSVGQARLETLWQRAQILGLAACFKVTDAELRRMVLLASQSSTEIFDCLVARGFGLDTILILLCAFERQLGQARMRQLFGAAMQPDFPATLARLLENGGLQGLSRREDIKLRAELIIRQLHRANNLAGRKPLVQELARSVQS